MDFVSYERWSTAFQHLTGVKDADETFKGLNRLNKWLARAGRKLSIDEAHCLLREEFEWRIEFVWVEESKKHVSKCQWRYGPFELPPRSANWMRCTFGDAYSKALVCRAWAANPDKFFELGRFSLGKKSVDAIVVAITDAITNKTATAPRE